MSCNQLSISIVAADGLMLKQYAISIHNIGSVPIIHTYYDKRSGYVLWKHNWRLAWKLVSIMAADALVPFLRRAMNCGTRITGQLRQPTTSLHTWPITWDIKGCLCLFKHHSPKHTPDWYNYVYCTTILTKSNPIIEYRRKMQYELKCQEFFYVKYIPSYPYENWQQPV